MKNSHKPLKKSLLFLIPLFAVSCSDDIELNSENFRKDNEEEFSINFQQKSTIDVGNQAAAEITAFDPETNKLFIVNNDIVLGIREISVYNISDINTPIEEPSIDLSALGGANSVSVKKGKLAIAVEAPIKQNPGTVLVYDTKTQLLENTFTVGALPDMITFTPDGKKIVVANEGEPNDDFSFDPEGSISVIDLKKNNVVTLDFHAFNLQETALEAKGFRVFSPNANLSRDVEPEYVAVSKNSKTAWVALQENNGLAEVDLENKRIVAIYPLGFKDYSLPGNEIDASDKDNQKRLKHWSVPVYGMYQPDGIKYMNINGKGYIFSANEGDSRDYTGFSEEARVADLILNPSIFPAQGDYQNNANLGRLKITNALKSPKNKENNALYSFGARSFSVWSTKGALLYDSGNDIGLKTLELTPNVFNGNDKRSDDKGAEPETVDAMKLCDDKYVLFVGLERDDEVLVYDISNPVSPQFVQILTHPGDSAPEGLLAISRKDSPTKKPLLVVSNEGSGTVTIYENKTATCDDD
ncbi:choice-of-anchor I family protein [Aquimarina aquimarini]|uniref:choice-of-anchor I family protein n=1 Tax=Aquimarina aquimarini TaxID=1191734 RepID=UPI000D55ED4A|nr:choice-of-anchor I family protein [Aquimarina aquimarini]